MEPSSENHSSPMQSLEMWPTKFRPGGGPRGRVPEEKRKLIYSEADAFFVFQV